LTLLDNKLVFSANNGIIGNELFAWDGLNSPVTVDNIRGCSNGSNPYITDIINEKLFIIANSETSTRGLWIYDGYNAPEKMPDACSGKYCFGPTSDLILFNNKLYFRANYGEIYGNELWAYDGINKPELVFDIDPGPGWSNPSDFIIFRNRLYFTAEVNYENREIWTYDGINPPVMLMDIDPDLKGPGPSSMFIFKDRLFFLADDMLHGRELWVYDGFNQPSILADLNSGEGDGLSGFIPVLYNGKLYFGANDGVLGLEPYEFDGTNPPSMVYDINPGPPGSKPGFFDSEYNGKLYLSANDGIHGRELWEWDGVNPPGMIADMNPGSYMDIPNSSSPTLMKIYKGKMYFRAYQAIYNDDIWEYDGTNLNCITTDISFGCAPLFGGSEICDSSLYFDVVSDDHCRPGGQFWVYDGNKPPSLVVEIEGTDGLVPSGLTLFKNKLYFSTEDSCEGRELFYLCGTDSTLTTTACTRYNFNGRWLTSSGIYYDTILNAAGCDSMITLNLTIVEMDTAIITNDNILTSAASNAHYQWIDCDVNFKPMDGQTNRSFEVTRSGNYAVIISQNNCIDTSKCISVHVTGIKGNKNENGISIYPNPVNDELTIDLNPDMEDVMIEITNVNGEVVLRNQYSNNKTLKLDVSVLSPGVFVVKIVGEKGVVSAKIIIQVSR